MPTAQQVAQAFAKLTPQERKEAIQLVPELLRIEEAFILRRWRQARRDLLAGRVVPAHQAIASAQAKQQE